MENKGNVFTGFIGALIGAAIGAVLWAAVGIFGYIASVVGLVIAFLAGKGYDLFKGRQGAAKVVVLILCVVLAVVAGNAGSYAWQIHDVYEEETQGLSAEEMNYVVSEAEFFELMIDDSEIRTGFLKDCGMGLFFAALGCIGILRDAGKKKSSAPAEQE